MTLQCAKVAASLKKDLTESYWASEGRDSTVEAHLSHAVREMTEVMYIIVTGHLHHCDWPIGRVCQSKGFRDESSLYQASQVS